LSSSWEGFKKSAVSKLATKGGGTGSNCDKSWNRRLDKDQGGPDKR